MGRQRKLLIHAWMTDQFMGFTASQKKHVTGWIGGWMDGK
jgi:hypothetical protein